MAAKMPLPVCKTTVTITEDWGPTRDQPLPAIGHDPGRLREDRLMNTENLILWQWHTEECEAKQCRDHEDQPRLTIACSHLKPRCLHGVRY